MKLFYRCVDHCEESFYEFESTMFFGQSDDFDLVAEEAAEDYFVKHDGSGSDWPLTFSLHETDGGSEIDRYTVSIDMSPTFNAVQVE